MKTMIDEAIRPLLLRAAERGGGGSGEIRLREAQRQHRLLEAARRQEVREGAREDKVLRKESRKFYESIGFTKKAAKAAAKAGFRERGIEPSLLHSEAGVRLAEAARGEHQSQRVREAKERKSQLKEGRRIFENLGLDKEAARFAAAGRR